MDFYCSVNHTWHVGSDNVYNRRVEPMLVSLSSLYSIDKILVDDSRPSSYPAYTIY